MTLLALGVVRALCYNNTANQTRARLAGIIKVQRFGAFTPLFCRESVFCSRLRIAPVMHMLLQCLVKFLGAVDQIELVAEAAGEDYFQPQYCDVV